MKNKIMKLLGIALTLAVLVGMLVPAMPTSAGNNAWTDIKAPPNTDKLQLTDNSEISAMAVAPDGKTIFVWDNQYEYVESPSAVLGAPLPYTGMTPTYDIDATEDHERLLKSTDGGVTFAEVKIDEDDDIYSEDAIIQLVVSPKFATDKTIVAACSFGDVYISDDAGESWMLLDDIDVSSLLNVDFSYDENGNYVILVATSGDVYLYSDRGNKFINLSGSINTEGFVGDNSIFAAKFSPNFSDDGQIVVVDNDDNQTLLETVIVFADMDEADDIIWNDSARVTYFVDSSGDDIVGPTSAVIAFPSDYVYNNTKAVIFVGLNYSDLLNDEVSNVYRVTLARSGDSYKKATDLKFYDSDAGSDFAITSIDYKGTISSGTLVIGGNQGGDAAQVYRTKNAGTGTSPDWFAADKEPMGINPIVEFSAGSDTLFVGTSSIYYSAIGGYFGSALYTSADYNSFDGISLISFPALHTTFTTSWNSRYIVMTEPSGKLQVLFISKDSGATWKMSTANVAYDVNLKLNTPKASSAIATDNTFYIYLTSTSVDNLLYKTTNMGATYDEVSFRTDDKIIRDMTLIDANNFLLLGPGGKVYKNGSSRTLFTIEDTDGEPVKFGTYSPTFMVIETAFGSKLRDPGYLYFSGDNGVTFKKLGDMKFKASVYDAAARTVYMNDADNTHELYKYNVDNSTDFESVDTIDLAFLLDGENEEVDNVISGINMSNGVWYAQIEIGDTEEEQLYPQYWRCVNISASSPTWEPIPGSTPKSLKGIIGSRLGAGNMNVLVYPTYYRTWGKLAMLAKNWNDSLVNGPTISSPANNATVADKFNVNWAAVDAGSKSVTYMIQIATDNSFNGKITLENAETSATTYYVNPDNALVAGTTYYARVKVSGDYADGTVSSKWSPTVAFIVKLNNDYIVGVIGSRIAPAAGAVGVPQKPTFQWGAVPGATGYELVIDNGAAIKLTDTTYVPDAAFAYGSTHTWKVRAMAGTVASDYVTSIFTVVGAPATTPPPTTPAPKFFDPNSGQYFDTQAQLDAFQAAWKAQNNKTTPAPETPAYIWVIIVIGAVLIIAVIVLIARTRRV